MDDLQLGAQHRARARRVNRPQHLLPEPPAHRQDGVIVRQDVLVLRARRNRRRGKLPRNFSGVRCQYLPHGFNLLRSLSQQYAPCHVFHVRVGKLHRSREPRPHPAKLWHVGTQRALARRHHQHSRVELLPQRFRDLHDLTGTLQVVAHVNLHFVQHQAGERQSVFAAQHFPRHPQKLRRRGVRRLREFARQQCIKPILVAESWIDFQQRFTQHRAHRQIIQLSVEVLARRLDVGPHLVVETVVFQVETEFR